MKDDEALYAQAGIELVNNPNQGLLVKCTTQFPNDPNQAKAEYVRVRLEQMKEDLALELETSGMSFLPLLRGITVCFLTKVLRQFLCSE